MDTTEANRMRQPINVDAIPEALRALPQWVAHRAKIPYNARTGSRASTTDPSTWSSFAEAYARCDRDERLEGVGYVFTKDAGIVGIDLDHCRNWETGELTPWSRIIVKALDTYTEVSQSGTGLHLYVDGSLPVDGKKCTIDGGGAIEVYGARRFFIVTGDHLPGTPTTIEHRQNDLDAIRREYFGEESTGDSMRRQSAELKFTPRANAEPPAERFALLWEHDLIFRQTWNRDRPDLKDPSQSGYDMALADIAAQAGWTAQEIVDILVAHRRKNAKADQRKTQRRDYYQRTLEKAFQLTSETKDKGDDKTTKMRTADSTKDIGLKKEIADAILKEYWFAQDAGKRLYVYRSGAYQEDGTEVIRRVTKWYLEQQHQSKKWSMRLGEEVAEYIRLDAPKLWPCPPLDVLNLNNGRLDLSTLQLKPHTPEHLSSIQLPVDFDPSATCPHWEMFIDQVFPDDASVLAYEIISLLMRPDVSIQKAVLLYGEGGNGKSTYTTAVMRFLGTKNVAAMSLHSLENDKFAVARLLNKLANVGSDLPTQHLMSTSVFKGIVGGDLMKAERKFEEPFEFIPFCRLVFSANHFPQSMDATQGFFRRWLVIPFERSFEAEKAVPRPILDARLAHPGELSGVLNKALEALPELVQRGGFRVCRSTIAAAQEFRERTDPIAAWLDRETAMEPSAFVAKCDVLISYQAYASSQGWPAISANAFGRALKRHRPQLREGQRTIGNVKREVWLGLSLIDGRGGSE